MKPEIIIQQRLNELMNDYGVSYTDIEKNTGITRQTITKYFTGQSNVPLHFMRKFYSYLKSKDPKKNLNFLYLIDPNYPTKNTITEKDLKIVGFNQETIDNLYKIVEYKENNDFEALIETDDEYYEIPKLNKDKFYIFNLILSSPRLSDIVDEISNLYLKLNGQKLRYLDKMDDDIARIKSLLQDKMKNNSKSKEEIDFNNKLLNDIQTLSIDADLMKREQEYNLEYNENPDYFNFLKWKLEGAIRSLIDDIFNKIVYKK